MKANVFKIAAILLILAGVVFSCEKPNMTNCGDVCDVENPLADLPWLKAYCDSIKKMQGISSVAIDLYKIIDTDEHVFKIGVSYPNFEVSPFLYSEYWRNCTGELIFNVHSGISPNTELVENFMKDKEFVAELFHEEPAGGQEYPVEIPFTEYSLTETGCWWTNIVPNKVIVINNTEELKNYIECTDSGYSEIDFSKQTLIVAYGMVNNGIHNIEKQLMQTENNEYNLNVLIEFNDTEVMAGWLISIVTPKIDGEATVTLSKNSSEGEDVPSLKDTKWKLAGIADAETGTLKELEPKGCDECYTLTFDTDSTAAALSIWAIYYLDFTDLNIARDICKPDNLDLGGTLPCLDAEGYKGILYKDSHDFRTGISYAKSYEATSKEIKLFFNHLGHRYYLLFKPV